MCEAKQYSDQMMCGLCGLAWDVNDPEPPECRGLEPPSIKQPLICEIGPSPAQKILELFE